MALPEGIDDIAISLYRKGVGNLNVMFIPWWGIAVILLAMAILATASIQLYRRAKRLKGLVLRLEGLTESELHRQLKEQMLQYHDGG